MIGILCFIDLYRRRFKRRHLCFEIDGDGWKLISAEKTAARLDNAGCCFHRWLYIVVKVEFMRMRPKLDIVDFVFGFILNPHIDGVPSKDIAFQKKFLIFF